MLSFKPKDYLIIRAQMSMYIAILTGISTELQWTFPSRERLRKRENSHAREKPLHSGFTFPGGQPGSIAIMDILFLFSSELRCRI